MERQCPKCSRGLVAAIRGGTSARAEEQPLPARTVRVFRCEYRDCSASDYLVAPDGSLEPFDYDFGEEASEPSAGT